MSAFVRGPLWWCVPRGAGCQSGWCGEGHCDRSTQPAVRHDWVLVPIDANSRQVWASASLGVDIVLTVCHAQAGSGRGRPTALRGAVGGGRALPGKFRGLVCRQHTGCTPREGPRCLAGTGPLDDGSLAGHLATRETFVPTSRNRKTPCGWAVVEAGRCGGWRVARGPGSTVVGCEPRTEPFPAVRPPEPQDLAALPPKPRRQVGRKRARERSPLWVITNPGNPHI